MKRSVNIVLIVLFITVPLFCYFFLDQLYSSRFYNFSEKWLAREKPILMSRSESLDKILEPYQEVLEVSDDLDGFGVFEKGKRIMAFGDRAIEKIPSHIEKNGVEIVRIGFLKFQTFVPIAEKDDIIVYFIFSDDMAYVNFLILVGAATLFFILAFVARNRFAKMREQTIRETTVHSIQNMAHDFRAPFGKLRIFMSELKRDSPSLFSKLKDMNEDLEAAVEHADDVLIDFLSLDAKTEMGPVDAQEMVKRLKAKYFSMWNKEYSGINLEFVCNGPICFQGNEKKTLRVLYNLSDNALKHARSRVEITIEQNDGKALFRVANDGKQISPRQLKEIFKPFVSQRRGGIGLGLFICQSFVKTQGGKLLCSSTPDLTSFYFELPLAKRTAPNKVEPKEELSTRKCRIAYIDDEKFYLDAFLTMMKGQNVAIETFKHTDEILLKLRSGDIDYDLIIVDRYGPNFDAVEDRFSESCRDFGYLGPVVLYSNSVVDQVKDRVFFAVLDKTRPLTSEKVFTIIKESKNESI